LKKIVTSVRKKKIHLQALVRGEFIKKHKNKKTPKKYEVLLRLRKGIPSSSAKKKGEGYFLFDERSGGGSVLIEVGLLL